MHNDSFEDFETENKAYTVNEYNNSDGDPLGISLNGKTRIYIDAHEALKNKIKKGSQYTADDLYLRVLDVKNIPAVKTAIIEVSYNGKARGNAELKIYRPSIKKKKGATIEMRKSAGYDYEQVDILRNIVVHFLDKFMRENKQGEVTSLRCEDCNWETKSKVALKAHMSRLHSKGIAKSVKNKVKHCTINTLQSLSNQSNKRKKAKSVSQSSSLESSMITPPRKRDCLDDSDKKSKVESLSTSGEGLVVAESGKSELALTTSDLKEELLGIIDSLNTRITLLESQNKSLQEDHCTIKYCQKYLITKLILKEPPKHLKYVNEQHIPYLNGYMWRFIAKGNGACATNCVAVALFGDEGEASSVKRMTLDHMAEFYEEYYFDKIGLPYTETVGTGKSAKTITITTKEEMITYLKSEEALLLWSNCHELHAMANIFNVNFNVFSYGKGKVRWSKTGPNPDIVKRLGSESKVNSDIALYHADENHFDLLVECNSSLATFGLESERKVDMEHSSKVNFVNDSFAEELLLKEVVEKEVDIQVLNDDIVGTDCMDVDIVETNNETTPKPIKCSSCDLVFDTKETLTDHEKVHQVVNCDHCDETFMSNSQLEKHSEKHKGKKLFNRWNCGDCEFRSMSLFEFRKHMKESGHQPGKDTNSKKQILEDYRECYTCKMDFDGYVSLMQHRKEVHPSNKKCKNFASGKCIHGVNCWYVHQNDQETVEESQSTFNCNLCDETLTTRIDFMVHKKQVHPNFVPECEKFSMGRCLRDSKDCWFIHKDTSCSPSIPSDSVFQKDLGKSLPPDNVDKMVQLMEKLHITMQTLAETLKK